MISSLIFATALGGAPAMTDPPDQSIVERFREACVATEMKRRSFESAFSNRGFEPLLRVVHAGQPRPTNWSVGFGDGPVQLVMEGKLRSDEATDCGVLLRLGADVARAEVERLAQELNMRPTTPTEAPYIRDALSWSTADGSQLSLHYEIHDDAVVVRFARPAVSSQ